MKPLLLRTVYKINRETVDTEPQVTLLVWHHKQRLTVEGWDQCLKRGSALIPCHTNYMLHIFVSVQLTSEKNVVEVAKFESIVVLPVGGQALEANSPH